MRRLLLSFMLLAGLYLLVVGHLGPWDLLIGAVLAGLLLAFFRGHLFEGAESPRPGLARQVLGFLPLVAATLTDAVKGTWEVAVIVLGIRPLARPGVVEVPLGERSPNGVAVTALATTLSPGSVLLDVDWERRVMIFHHIDARDPDAIRRGHETFYRRYQRHVFP